MPEPMAGMVGVAEYGSRWDADLAAALLTEAGIEATVLGDPASTVAPHHVTERWFTVCVRREVAAEAGEVLSSPGFDHLDAEFHHRRFRDRPRWIRFLTVLLVVAVPVPILITVVLLIGLMVRSLFP